MKTQINYRPHILSTGLSGLDDIFGGGLTPNRVYGVEDKLGTEKTTTGLQFLLEGARQEASVVYVTLAETNDQLQGVADSHGWSMDRIHSEEVLTSEDLLRPDALHTMLHPSEAEMGATLQKILLVIDERKPARVVIDSMAQLQLLAGAQRGQPSAIFLFEEATSNLLSLADGLGMAVREHHASGLLTPQQIDAAELSPGKLTATVCSAADEGECVVVIDSVDGFLSAMPDERFLTTHVHKLLTYLGQRSVASIQLGVQQGMLDASMSATLEASYPADNVLMRRYFEHDSEVTVAVSVYKKRGRLDERTIHQFSVSSRGIEVGNMLRGFGGILTGTLVYPGASDLPDRSDESAVGLTAELAVAAGLHSSSAAEVL